MQDIAGVLEPSGQHKGTFLLGRGLFYSAKKKVLGSELKSLRNEKSIIAKISIFGQIFVFYAP